MRSSSTSQKRVQETPPKSKPRTHQRRQEGEWGRRGTLKAAGWGRAWVPPTQRIYSRWWNLQYDTPSLAVTHTHTHTHSRTLTRSPFTQKQAPTLLNTHTLTQTPCDETVSSNLQSLLCAADGMAHGYLPQIGGGSKEHPKIKGQRRGAARTRSTPDPSPPDRFGQPGASQSAGVSARRVPRIMARLFILMRYLPRPQHSAACIEMITRAVSVPALLHFAQPRAAASEAQWRREY